MALLVLWHCWGYSLDQVVALLVCCGIAGSSIDEAVALLGLAQIRLWHYCWGCGIAGLAQIMGPCRLLVGACNDLVVAKCSHKQMVVLGMIDKVMCLANMTLNHTLD